MNTKENNQNSEPKQTLPPEAVVIKEAIESFIGPLADAEKVKAIEETKRYTVWFNLIRESIRWIFIFAFAILGFIILVYLYGDKELAEKIIFALLGFIGGFGFGSRWRRKH